MAYVVFRFEPDRREPGFYAPVGRNSWERVGRWHEGHLHRGRGWLPAVRCTAKVDAFRALGRLAGEILIDGAAVPSEAGHVVYRRVGAGFPAPGPWPVSGDLGPSYVPAQLLRAAGLPVVVALPWTCPPDLDESDAAFEARLAAKYGRRSRALPESTDLAELFGIDLEGV